MVLQGDSMLWGLDWQVKQLAPPTTGLVALGFPMRGLCLWLTVT